MTPTRPPLLMRSSAFGWAAVATGIVLLIPLIAMHFTSEVRWSGMDFAVMGALFFGTCSAFVLAARRLPRRHRLTVAIICVLVFLFVWAELAVGIFTEIGT